MICQKNDSTRLAMNKLQGIAKKISCKNIWESTFAKNIKKNKSTILPKKQVAKNTKKNKLQIGKLVKRWW